MKNIVIFSALFSLFLLGVGCQNASVETAPEVSSLVQEDAQEIEVVSEVSSPAKQDVQEIEIAPEVLPLTQEEVQDIFDYSVPENIWRMVDQWLALENGNLWVLTRQAGSIGDPPQTNPCAQTSYCPTESWIVDPSVNKAYLTSSQNSYYAGIVVSSSQTEDDYVHLDWEITHLTSHSIVGKEIFSEEFSIEDGSLR